MSGEEAVPSRSDVAHLVGRRCSAAGDRGTVRWAGTPARRPESETWLGVEWDDAARGKNDGSVAGVRYFHLVSGGSGSLVKVAKVTFGVTLMQACLAKYRPDLVAKDNSHSVNANADAFISSMRNNPIRIELVGESQALQRYSKLDQLTDVTLTDSEIASPGPDGEVKKTIPAIERLDIANNLLSSWQDVAKISVQLKQLHWLRVSHNTLGPITSDRLSSWPPSAFANLQILVANTVRGVTWSGVQVLLGSAPQLHELHLCGNGIASLTSQQDDRVDAVWERVTVLNFEANSLTWQEMRKLAWLPSLSTLNVNNNAISEITADVACDPAWRSLVTLNLGRNPLAAWTSVSAIDATFPSIADLRMPTGGVAGDDETSPWIARQLVIARVAKLTRLNGSTVRPRERLDAETYYLQQCALALQTAGDDPEAPPAEFSAKHPRYDQLRQRDGVPAVADPVSQDGGTLEEKMVEIELRCHAGGHVQMKGERISLPLAMTIGNVKRLCLGKFDIPVDQQRIFHRASADQGFPLELDVDQRCLDYFGVRDGHLLIVEEQSDGLHNVKSAADQAKELHEKRLQEQLKRANDSTRVVQNDVAAAKSAVTGTNNMPVAGGS